MMYCPGCGNEVVQSARFCGVCGRDLQSEAAVVEQQSRGTDPTPKKKSNKKLIIGICVAVVVIIALIVGILLWQSNQRSKAEYDADHAKHAVTLSIAADGYSNDSCTRIPIQVSGEDADGNAVDEVVFVRPDDTSELALASGSYTLSFPASPLSSEGTFWEAPDDMWAITIDSTLDANTAFEGLANTTITYNVIDSADITDEMVDNAATYASKDVDNAGVVDGYVTATKEKRDAAAAGKASQQQAAEKQSKIDAATQSGMQVVSGTIHVDTGTSIGSAKNVDAVTAIGSGGAAMSYVYISLDQQTSVSCMSGDGLGMTTISAQLIQLPDTLAQYDGQSICLGFYATDVFGYSDAMGALFDVNATYVAPEVIWVN